MNKSLIYSILIVASSAALYLVGSAQTGFSGTDELRYGQITKELGPNFQDYFLLHFNGVRYTDKPPPYFWAARVGYALTGGVSPLGLRLPGVASAIACFVLVFFMMRSLTRNEKIALASAAMMMVAPRFFWIGRWGRLDIMMCAFIYAGMFQFIRAWFERKGQIGSVWFWTCLGCSFAVKGPAGPVVMLGTAITFMIWESYASGAVPSGFVAKLKHGWGIARPLFRWPGIVAALLVNLAWYGPIFIFDRTSGSTDMVVDELVSRTFTPDRHVQPPYYYFKNIWYDALPAMPFVLFAGIMILLERRDAKRAEGASVGGSSFFGQSPQATRFLISWLVFTLIFFSIYPPKRAQYLLPMYPAVAGLGALFVDYCARQCADGASARAARLFRIPSGLLLFLVTILAAVMIWRVELAGLATRILEESNPELAFDIQTGIEEFEYGVFHLSRVGQIIGSLAVLVIATLSVLFLRRRNIWQAFALTVTSAYAGMFFFMGWMVPPVFPDDDLKRFAAETAQRLKERPELEICMYGEDKPFFNIYGDFHIHYYEDSEVKDLFFEYVEKTSPVMVILEDKEAKKYGDDELLRGMTRRETTMRGERVVVFETPE